MIIEEEEGKGWLPSFQEREGCFASLFAHNRRGKKNTKITENTQKIHRRYKIRRKMKETENESIQRKILHKNCPMKYFSQEEKNQKKTHKKGRQLTIENLEGSRATRTMLPGGR